MGIVGPLFGPLFCRLQAAARLWRLSGKAGLYHAVKPGMADDTCAEDCLGREVGITPWVQHSSKSFKREVAWPNQKVRVSGRAGARRKR